MSWKLYHKDGTALTDVNGKEIVAHSLTYDGEWMGECAITMDISNEAPIDFQIGDYIIYRDERFELNYDPGKVKKGRRDVLGDSFKYSSIKFNSLSDELARAEFLDVVLNDNELHYTALPDFTFYIASLDDLLDRLQANMNEHVGNNKWKFYSRNWGRSKVRGCDAERWKEIYGGDPTKEDTGVVDTSIDSTSISIQQQTVWEGLSLVNSQFDINFIIRNREVFIDTTGLPTRNIFKYGKGNGLYEVNQDAESDQQIVTRLKAYGSEKNLPNRYYATLNMEVWSYRSEQKYIEDYDDGKICNFAFKIDEIDVKKASTYFTYRTGGGQGYDTYLVNIHDGGVVVEAKVSVGVEPYYENHVDVQILGGEGRNNTIESARACIAAIKATKRVHFVNGVNKDAFPTDRRDYAAGEHLPNNMACSRLMLPGFPLMSLQEWWDKNPDKHKELNPTGANLRFSTRSDRPWIESAEADKIGKRPGSVYFDKEDIKEKLEEIYPTIKEMTIGGVRIDEIEIGTNVTDNGIFKDVQTAPGCRVELKKEVVFDVNFLKKSDFSITMTDGMCAGRTFKVAGSVKENGRWVFTLQRVQDNDIYYPYKDYQISHGDHFVLSGIELPMQYVEAASEKLLKYAIAWLIENDHTRYTYSPKVDEIFMARQHDEAIADTTGTLKSLHDTLKEGDIMQFTDEDFGLDADVIIDKLSIKEENGKIPTYEITLRDDKEVGTLQKMQEQITAIGRNSGGNLTPAQVKEYVRSEGSKLFLSKLQQDIAQKLIRFWEGIAFGDDNVKNSLGITAEGVATLTEVISNVFSAGALGTGFRLGSYGDTTDSYLEVDRLLVRKVAEFIELVIRELRHVGGEIVLTPAAMKCVRVEAMDESDSVTTGTPHHWRCYFTAEQDGKTIKNDFVAGDLVRCQTFNVKEGDNANAKNKYYWRKVSGVGDDYIDVLFTDGDTNSDVPAAGDEMVQLGSTVAGRQSAILLSSYGDDAPSIKCYRGINSYSLEGKAVFVVSKEMIDIIADRLRYRTADGVVDVADKFASIELDANGLKIQVSQQGEAINEHTTQLGTLGDTLKQQGEEIKGMDSKITQTATQISLSVGLTLSERKNMLVGSAFRKQGEGCRYNGATITRTMGYDGTNALRCMGKGTIGARWLGGNDGYSNVRLEKGKTYTLSFLARAASAGATVVAEVIWQGTAKDASRPAGYAGPVGSGAVISESVVNDGQWHAYQKTFTVPANAAYEWVEVFVFANNDADHTVYIARPMLAESIFTDVDKVDDSKYTGWSLSAEDYDYIGGNMLDNCRRLTIGGNLTAVGSIDDTTAYDLRCATIHAKSTTTQMAVVAQWQVEKSIVGGKDYILQFMAKGKGMIKAYMYGGSNISIYAESSGESMEKDATADGYRFIELTDSWAPCWVHWRSVGSGTPQNVLLRVEDGAEAWVTMPKMEAGAKPTDWTDTNTDYSENASVASKLLRSGLDIENGKITATANSFEVRNNAGETTASVNKDGVFVTNEAVLHGSIYAENGYFAGQIKHKKIKVNKSNFFDYFHKVDKSIRDNAYAPIFEELGSNMYIDSVPDRICDEGIAYMWLPNIFPTTNPYNDNRYEQARECVGNTISIRLSPSCDIGVLVYGVATADSDGSNVRESSATIEAGETAYLTCRVGRSGYLNESGSLVTGVEIVYWEAIVGKTIDNANAHNLINL